MPASPPRPPATHADLPEMRTLIDELIAEQQSLQTPVARFSEIHDRKPDLSDHYRTLIPLTRPAIGEQYAFEVSLDRCTGCKACVSACHSLNGLDDGEAWRDTGALVGGDAQPGWQQTVTTACHHCEDPGCMNGCPVGAYEKDFKTGIVRHLDDQCIGCSYCILKCPYDVPKYSKKRGIVRKCDMCHQRLADGEAPACVQACPTEAIRIVTVPKLHPRSLFFHAPLESTIPDSSITRPTTRYIGRRFPSTTHAADRDALVPQHTHWPLVLMLVLTQAGIGMLGAAGRVPSITVTATLLFFLGMAAAVLHLGQPLKAWRFFLGLRTSWLSREILAFGLFAPIPILLTAIGIFPGPIHELSPLSPHLISLVSYSAIPLGLIAVFTSVMIYHDTRRSFWHLRRTAARFYGTTFLFATLAASIGNPAFASVFACLSTLKLIGEWSILPAAKSPIWSPDRHTARMLSGPLRRLFIARTVLATAAAAIAFLNPWAALPVLVAAELLERMIFFQAVHAPKMPGNFGPPAP